ncbi:cytomatrix protein-related, partial [Striga hermonthica]
QWFDYLTKKCEEPKDDVYNNREAGSENKALKNEVRKLKNEIEKCKLDKNSEITALLAEKKFVWHQLKKTEDDLKKEIKRKDEEVKCANEKLRQMVNTAEELQLSHENLKTNFARLEAESVQKSEEILRLCKEIKLLKSRSEPPSTLSRLCSASGRKRGKKGDMSNEGVMKVKTEADNPQTAQKVNIFLFILRRSFLCL